MEKKRLCDLKSLDESKKDEEELRKESVWINQARDGQTEGGERERGDVSRPGGRASPSAEC